MAQVTFHEACVSKLLMYQEVGPGAPLRTRVRSLRQEVVVSPRVLQVAGRPFDGRGSWSLVVQ